MVKKYAYIEQELRISVVGALCRFSKVIFYALDKKVLI